MRRHERYTLYSRPVGVSQPVERSPVGMLEVASVGARAEDSMLVPVRGRRDGKFTPEAQSEEQDRWISEDTCTHE